jgi:predicted metallopeptidase
MASSNAFDFSAAMCRLCNDISARVEEFNHIRMDEVAVAFAQTRRRVSYGLQAKLTPLRFENGALTARRDGRQWTVQRLYDNDRELLYILTFYLPRFLDQTFREKMITVFHELYHISPCFDGDIRRMGGRYHVHSHSQTEYDRLMGVFADRYLQLKPPPDVYGFLRLGFRGLLRRHGSVVGLQIPIPKIIPIPDTKTA